MKVLFIDSPDANAHDRRMIPPIFFAARVTAVPTQCKLETNQICIARPTVRWNTRISDIFEYQIYSEFASRQNRQVIPLFLWNLISFWNRLTRLFYIAPKHFLKFLQMLLSTNDFRKSKYT